MDQPASDGKFHYRNKSLDFKVTLPSSFEYYQTQRKETDDYVDIEFLVPTSDLSQDIESIRGYARPLVVRAFHAEAWKTVDKKGKFKKIGEKDDRVYAVDFWEDIPEDWQEEWNEEIRGSILESFQLQDL